MRVKKLYIYDTIVFCRNLEKKGNNKACMELRNELMRLSREDKAIRDPMGRHYSFSKDVICTLPRCGGDDRFRPSVQMKKKK